MLKNYIAAKLRSLSDIQKFIPSDSINNIILSLTQSNMYGSSIIDTMHSQIDYL